MSDEQRDSTEATERGGETLKFYFTPVDPSLDGGTDNPHAKSTSTDPEAIEGLRAQLAGAVLAVSSYANEDTVLVRTEKIVDVCRFLKEAFGYSYLVDLGGNDRFTEEDRLEVIYNIVSMERQKRLRLLVRVSEESPVVPSVTPVYRAANWNERECYDMLGIVFDGHEDLRRMFMPEDFEYHPQRKEFPLLGIPGSLPLPPQTPDGKLTMDPFAAAHGRKPRKSYEEDVSANGEDH